jgi:DNA excision repair protein ERCC-2
VSTVPSTIPLTDSTTDPVAPLGAKELPTYKVAVRQLCEFAAKRGDLDSRFTPAPTSLQGMEGHREVASRRSATYEREITLTDVQGSLQVRGRADGYDPNSNRVEEVKTHRGDLERMPSNHRFLHWAQAKVYAHLICVKHNLHETDVALVYFDVSSRQETVLTQRYDSTSLASSYLALCEQFLSWSKRELEHRRQRNAVLESLQFPHAQFRPGQRILAAAVYRASVLICS